MVLNEIVFFRHTTTSVMTSISKQMTSPFGWAIVSLHITPILSPAHLKDFLKRLTSLVIFVKMFFLAIF